MGLELRFFWIALKKYPVLSAMSWMSVGLLFFVVQILLGGERYLLENEKHFKKEDAVIFLSKEVSFPVFKKRLFQILGKVPIKRWSTQEVWERLSKGNHLFQNISFRAQKDLFSWVPQVVFVSKVFSPSEKRVLRTLPHVLQVKVHAQTNLFKKQTWSFLKKTLWVLLIAWIGMLFLVCFYYAHTVFAFLEVPFLSLQKMGHSFSLFKFLWVGCFSLLWWGAWWMGKLLFLKSISWFSDVFSFADLLQLNSGHFLGIEDGIAFGVGVVFAFWLSFFFSLGEKDPYAEA